MKGRVGGVWMRNWEFQNWMRGVLKTEKNNRGNHSVTYGHVFEVLLINLLHVGGGQVSCVI